MQFPIQSWWFGVVYGCKPTLCIVVTTAKGSQGCREEKQNKKTTKLNKLSIKLCNFEFRPGGLSLVVYGCKARRQYYTEEDQKKM